MDAEKLAKDIATRLVAEFEQSDLVVIKRNLLKQLKEQLVELQKEKGGLLNVVLWIHGHAVAHADAERACKTIADECERHMPGYPRGDKK